VKEFGLKTLLISLAVIIALIVSEAVIRILHPELVGRWSERGNFYTYDSLLGWKGKPNATGVFVQKDFKVQVRHNDKGFRGENYSYQRVPNKRRILVIGDSYVWGYGVEEQEIFTTLLENALKQTEVINLGCTGYGNDQELLLLKQEGVKYNPDLVIVVVTLPSDFFNNTHSVQYSCPKPYFLSDHDSLALKNVPVPKRNPLQCAGNFLTQKSALYVYLKFLTPKSIKINSQEVQITFDLLKEMRSVCRLNGIESLVIIAPTIEPKTDVIYRTEKSKKLLNLLESDTFNVINLVGSFENCHKNHEKLTFGSDAHWNKSGHKRVSMELLAYLTSLK
jgi:hypothetical protein